MLEKIYFINENYEWMPDLLIEEDDLGPTMVQGTHLTLDRPVRYRTTELPSSCAKSFSDLDGIMVSREIAKIVEEADPDGLLMVPVQIRFTDGVSLPYYRLDSELEHNVIDYSNSNIIDGDEDDGYSFDQIAIDQEKLAAIPKSKKMFFRLKGLEIIQYMISTELKQNLDMLEHHILITDEESYDGI